MANNNNPFGLRPISRAGGAPFRTSQYGKPSSDSNTIFMFDLVVKVAASVPDPTGLGNPMPAIETGYQGTPGTTLWQGVTLNYGAASTATPHYVVDEVDALFMTQCSGTTSITAASHAGKNANVTLATAGSATTKISGIQINSASIATTSSLDLRIRSISNLSPNVEGANAIVEVLINKHELGQQTAGV